MEPLIQQIYDLAKFIFEVVIEPLKSDGNQLNHPKMTLLADR
jgi:hypothetical protein